MKILCAIHGASFPLRLDGFCNGRREKNHDDGEQKKINVGSKVLIHGVNTRLRTFFRSRVKWRRINGIFHGATSRLRSENAVCVFKAYACGYRTKHMKWKVFGEF